MSPSSLSRSRSKSQHSHEISQIWMSSWTHTTKSLMGSLTCCPTLSITWAPNDTCDLCREQSSLKENSLLSQRGSDKQCTSHLWPRKQLVVARADQDRHRPWLLKICRAQDSTSISRELVRIKALTLPLRLVEAASPSKEYRSRPKLRLIIIRERAIHLSKWDLTLWLKSQATSWRHSAQTRRMKTRMMTLWSERPSVWPFSEMQRRIFFRLSPKVCQAMQTTWLRLRITLSYWTNRERRAKLTEMLA